MLETVVVAVVTAVIGLFVGYRVGVTEREVLPRGKALEEECKKMGVVLWDIRNKEGLDESVAQQRLLAAWENRRRERGDRRQARLFWIALISASASAFSAAGAWLAVARTQ